MPGDPLHVLVIDELAALTAYADPDVRREAGRLLSEMLTQGRALGVVVVACVQDPRKETVGMRGLFTQTVALRLRSAEETRMVLGDGMADARAGAPDHPGRARAPGGWSRTTAPPTGSAPTTGPTRWSATSPPVRHRGPRRHQPARRSRRRLGQPPSDHVERPPRLEAPIAARPRKPRDPATQSSPDTRT